MSQRIQSAGAMLGSEGMNGFTLVELLVVIAIIGMLSSIVLASLNAARSKAADTAVRAQLAQMRTAAELLYEESGDYSTACDAATNPGMMFRAAYANVKTADGGSECITLHGSAYSAYWAAGGSISGHNTGVTNAEPAGEKWAAAILLKNGNYYCVDYTGRANETALYGRDGVDNSPTTVHCI